MDMGQNGFILASQTPFPFVSQINNREGKRSPQRNQGRSYIAPQELGTTGALSFTKMTSTSENVRKATIVEHFVVITLWRLGISVRATCADNYETFLPILTERLLNFEM